jgi:hypothetical protein
MEAHFIQLPVMNALLFCVRNVVHYYASWRMVTAELERKTGPSSWKRRRS